MTIIALSVLAQDRKKDDPGDLIDDAGKGTKFRLVALGKEDEKRLVGVGRLLWM
jgi:hypothetical protein